MIIPSTQRVMRHELEFESEPQIHLYCAKNEVRSFQIVEANKSYFNKEIFEMCVFNWHYAGMETKVAPVIDIYREEYIVVKKWSGDLRTEIGWYPDKLVWSIWATVPPRSSQGFWFDVDCGDIPAGDYTTKINDYKVTVTVWDFALPETRTMRTYFGKLETNEQRDILYEHGIVPMLETYPMRYSNDGIPEFDIKYKKALADYESKYKADYFFIPSFYASGGDKAENYFWAWADLISNKRIYVRGIDEPKKADYPKIRAYGEAANPTRVKQLVTEQIEDELIGYVDTWCPASHLLDKAKIKQRLAAGDEVWLYTALHYGEHQWLLDTPLVNYRKLAWLGYANGCTGMLYWSAIAGKPDDAETYKTGGKVWNGEGRLIYPEPSMRLKNIRDGLQDYEYFKMLEGIYDVDKLQEVAATEDVSLLPEIGMEIMNGSK